MEIANTKIKLFILILAMFATSSCDSYYEKQIGESYYIRYIDLKRTMDIGFGNKESSEGLIDPTVYEVYWNEKYILVKTHPDIIENRNLTEYYVIEKVKFGEKRARDFMKGPINKMEYENLIKQLALNLADMEHIVYDDLK